MINPAIALVFLHTYVAIGGGGVIYPQVYLGSRAPRNKIPTATPVFSGSNFSMELLPMLSDVSLYRKLKMAANKTEVVITSARNDISAKFQRLYLGFQGRTSQCNSDRQCELFTDVGTSNMASTNRK